MNRKDAPWYAVCYRSDVTKAQCPDGCAHSAGDAYSFGQMLQADLDAVDASRFAINPITSQPTATQTYDKTTKKVVSK